MRKIIYKGEECELINIQRKNDGTFIIFVITENNKLDWHLIENIMDIEIVPKPI